MKKFILSVFALAAVVSASAESKVEVSAGADLVSDYVFRGLDQASGFSVQPSFGLSIGGFSVGAWGSTSLDMSSKELDFTIGYELGNFSLSFTDYWWDGKNAANYFRVGSLEPTAHYGEVALGYTISEKFPLALSASMYVYGADKRFNDDGEEVQAYSTYLHASYPFAIKSFDFEAGIGVAPYKKGAYAIDHANSCITDINLCISRDIVFSEKFTLPLFVDTIFSPAYNDAYIVFGLSLNL